MNTKPKPFERKLIALIISELDAGDKQSKDPGDTLFEINQVLVFHSVQCAVKGCATRKKARFAIANLNNLAFDNIDKQKIDEANQQQIVT